MKKNAILVICVLECLLILVGCTRKADPASPSPAPTGIVTAIPSASPTEAEPTEAPEPTAKPSPDPDSPEALLIELPQDFTTNFWKKGHDEGFSCVFGDSRYYLTNGDIAMQLMRETGGKTEELFVGMCSEPLAGVTEGGFYFSTDLNTGDAEDSLTPDRLYFFDVKAETVKDMGEALRFCTQLDDCLIGARYIWSDGTGKNPSGQIKIIRFDLSDGHRTELAVFDTESADPDTDRFYAKWFGGKTVWFTFLYAFNSTDFGIFKLDVETGEYEKVADHGLPYAVDENGILYYGDFVYVG